MRRRVNVTLLVLAAAVLFMLCLQVAQLRGTDTDLFPRWYGLRQLLLHQRDPYGGEVTREIAAQTSFLQQRLSETHALSSVEISYGFLYPLPGALLIGPLALLPYHMALATWLAASAVCLPMAAGLVAWSSKPSPAGQRSGEVPALIVLALVLASVLFLPTLWNLTLAQPTTLAVTLVALSMWSSPHRGALSGATLVAAALLKPQHLVILAPLWLGYHSLHWRQHRSRTALAGALVAAICLVGTAFLLLPTWPIGFLAAVRHYPQVDTLATSTPAVFRLAQWAFPGPIATPPALAATALAIGWALYGWCDRAAAAQRGTFRSLVVTALVVPPAWPTSALILLLPLASTFGRLRRTYAVTFAAASATLSLVLLPRSLADPWHSGTIMILAYVMLIGIGQGLSRAMKGEGTLPALPATPNPAEP